MTHARTLRMENGGWILAAVLGTIGLLRSVWDGFSRRTDRRLDEGAEVRRQLAERVQHVEGRNDRLEAKVSDLADELQKLQVKLAQAEGENATLRQRVEMVTMERNQAILEKTELAKALVEAEARHARQRGRELEGHA
jgi:chromosome segregation ATPase